MSERFFPDGMPPPLANATTLPWWQAAAEHRLVVQLCSACQHTRLPPAPVCPQCRSADADWQEVSGRGELYTYTIVHRPIAAGQVLGALVVEVPDQNDARFQLVAGRDVARGGLVTRLGAATRLARDRAVRLLPERD